MGITGLLPLLSSIQKPCNLRAFRGLTLGVDAYVWLHRAAVASAMDIGLGRPTTKFIAPVMHRVRMLIHFGIIPYLVFDGDYLPSKAITEVSRAARRAESLRIGKSLLSKGMKAEAHKEFIKAIDITPEMARLLIEELKRNKIQYVVAPYEADAQLAYLERQGLIQGVISEDSDLLVFGIKRLLTKLDEHGDCIEINRRDFTALKSIHIAGWTDADFRRMAILSGCDYLPNIDKIGLKTAYQLVRKHKDIDRIVRVLQYDAKYTVPQDYLAEFTKAELTFLHQRVFCPEQQEVVMLTSFVGEQPADFGFIGKHVEPDIARLVARGELNPNTKLPIKLIYDLDNYRPSLNNIRRTKSMQSASELKGKPISEFFRSARIPLAELDPNSFIPSPSQRQVLQRQPSSIISTPVGRVYNRRPSINQSAPAVVDGRRLRVVSATQGTPLSKKPRLCSDDGPSGGKGEVRSRFFTLAASDPSPLQKMTNEQADDDSLWSDHSLDAALSQLPDDLDTPRDDSKVEIFTEAEEEICIGKEDNSAGTADTASGSEPSSSDDLLPSQTVQQTKASKKPPSISSVITPGATRMTKSFAELAKKYTLDYNTSPSIRKAPNTLVRSTSSTSRRRSSLFPYPTPESSFNPSTSTSLSDVNYPSLPSELSEDKEPKLPLLIPESPPKPTQSSTQIKGSEDCIVPCSDIEAEIEEALAWEDELNQIKFAAEAEKRPVVPRARTFGAWDLSRFAFTGRGE